jgi:hypothetical protein
MPLLWMLAFEIGCATWVAAPVYALIVAAPIIALFAFLTRSISASALGIDPDDRPESSWRRQLLLVVRLPLLFVLPIAGLFFLRETLDPLTKSDPIWLWPQPWSDAAVILASLYAAIALLLPQARGTSRGHVLLLWGLLLSAVAATVVPIVTYPNVWVVGEVVEHSSFGPLCVAALLLTAVLWMPRLRRPDDDQPGSTFPLTEAAALLILVFGLVNGFLIYVVDSAVLVLGVSAVVLWTATGVILLQWLYRDRVARAGAVVVERTKVTRRIGEPRLRVWIPAFLVAYPAINWFFFRGATAVVLGRELSSWSLFSALLLFNVGYLLLVWLLVSFGLDHVLLWAGREFFAKAGDVVRQLAEAAPLLLIFVAFFALTAETWQVAYKLTPGRMIELIVLLLVIAFILVLGWTVAVLHNKSAFRSWLAVAKQLEDKESAPDRRSRPVGAKVARAIRVSRTSDQLNSRLDPLSWLNAMLVLIAYQSFMFVAVAVSLLVTFMVLVSLAVSPEVAAVWIFGDGQEARQVELVKLSWEGFRQLLMLEPDLLISPWLRVPIFLTVFSILYFAAESLRTEDSRTRYLRGIDAGMRWRLALRLGHRRLFPPPPRRGLRHPGPWRKTAATASRHGRDLP